VAAQGLCTAAVSEVEVIHFRGAADTRVSKIEKQRKAEACPEAGEDRPGRRADHGALRSGTGRDGEKDSLRIFAPRKWMTGRRKGIVAVECASADWQDAPLYGT